VVPWRNETSWRQRHRTRITRWGVFNWDRSQIFTPKFAPNVVVSRSSIVWTLTYYTGMYWMVIIMWVVFQPIQLASREPSSGDVGLVTGWGVIREGSSAASPTLLQANVPIVQREACRRMYQGAITDRMICAGKWQTQTFTIPRGRSRCPMNSLLGKFLTIDIDTLWSAT